MNKTCIQAFKCFFITYLNNKWKLNFTSYVELYPTGVNSNAFFNPKQITKTTVTEQKISHSSGTHASKKMYFLNLKSEEVYFSAGIQTTQ
jgi:hypothetical protein